MSIRGYFVAASLFALVGCGANSQSQVEGLEGQNPVGGKLVFEGDEDDRHVEGVLLQFHPESGEKKDQIYKGRVVEGGFSINTYEGESMKFGVPDGQYIVTVSRIGSPPKGAPSIPSKYADPKTSDLKAQVEEGNNSFAFTLSK